MILWPATWAPPGINNNYNHRFWQLQLSKSKNISHSQFFHKICSWYFYSSYVTNIITKPLCTAFLCEKYKKIKKIDLDKRWQKSEDWMTHKCDCNYRWWQVKGHYKWQDDATLCLTPRLSVLHSQTFFFKSVKIRFYLIFLTLNCSPLFSLLIQVLLRQHNFRFQVFQIKSYAYN